MLCCRVVGTQGGSLRKEGSSLARGLSGMPRLGLGDRLRSGLGFGKVKEAIAAEITEVPHFCTTKQEIYSVLKCASTAWDFTLSFGLKQCERQGSKGFGFALDHHGILLHRSCSIGLCHKRKIYLAELIAGASVPRSSPGYKTVLQADPVDTCPIFFVPLPNVL